MDRKTGYVLGAICLLVIILLAVVFVADSKTKEVPSNVLLTVGKNQYTVDDYKNYQLLKNYEAGDISKSISNDDELNEAINNYIMHKLYYNAALKNQLALSSESDYAKEYTEKQNDLTPYGVTSDDYVSYKQETELVQSLKNNFGSYYTVPQEDYDSFVESYKSQDMYKTYSFRIMSIPYEVKESGDESELAEATESGEEVSEVTSGETEEKQDMSKEAQLLVAQNAVAQFRSGDDFQEIAKEYGNMRFTFVGTGYSLLQAGDLEYATSPLLKGKLGNSDEVYEAFLKLQPGECTDPIDQPEYNSFQVVMMETVDDGFIGEGEKELKSIILSEMMDSLILESATYEVNQSGLIQTL